MDELDLTRVVETFIPVAFTGPTAIAAWQSYLRQLQLELAPLIDDLRGRGLVRWFGFLVHDRASGVPTVATDDTAYIHLRLEVPPDVDMQDLSQALPATCLFTRAMPTEDLSRMDSMDVTALRGATALSAWLALGGSSDWALDLARAHQGIIPVPAQNIAQLVHYLGNQLQLPMVGIPSP